MGLFLAQVNVWSSIRPEKHVADRDINTYVSYGDYYLLNTNRCVDIIDKTTYLQCKYNQAPDDHRCSPDTIEFIPIKYGQGESDSYLEYLTDYADLVDNDKFGTFAIYPNMDRDETPVDTQIEWADIAYMYQTPRDFTLDLVHMVYYDKSWKRIVCLIDGSLPSILVEEYSD